MNRHPDMTLFCTHVLTSKQHPPHPLKTDQVNRGSKGSLDITREDNLLLAFLLDLEEGVTSEPSRWELSSPGLIPSENITERLESRPLTTPSCTVNTLQYHNILVPRLTYNQPTLNCLSKCSEINQLPVNKYNIEFYVQTVHLPQWCWCMLYSGMNT